MSKRDQDYNLIAALHDQLEDIESYDRYLKGAGDCDECAGLWRELRSHAEETVARIRAEIRRHVGA
jgi:hypothetical protein